MQVRIIFLEYYKFGKVNMIVHYWVYFVVFIEKLELVLNLTYLIVSNQHGQNPECSMYTIYTTCIKN